MSIIISIKVFLIIALNNPKIQTGSLCARVKYSFLQNNLYSILPLSLQVSDGNCYPLKLINYWSYLLARWLLHRGPLAPLSLKELPLN